MSGTGWHKHSRLNQCMIDVKASMMFPKSSKKHILMGSLNVLKEGVFNGIEMASKKGFGSKDLLT